MQVKKVEPNLVLGVEKDFFTPTSNLITVEGDGFAVINLKRSSFKNPFINYSEVTSFFEDPDVLSTRFNRIVGKPPLNIEYMQFKNVVNNTNRIVSVNHTIELGQEYHVTDETTLALFVYTNTNGTRISLLGEDYENKSTNATFVLTEAYQKEYLYFYTIPNSLKTINKLYLTQVCPPNGYFKGETLFRLLNIFENRPSIDSEPLVEGQNWVRIEKVTFPHIFY
jgi:hypothetical protein